MAVFKLVEIPTSSDGTQKPTKMEIRRRIIDLSFLEFEESSGLPKYGLFETQRSLAICGPNDFHWVAYSISETYNDTKEEEEEGDDDDDDEEEEEEDRYATMHMHDDPIVSDENGLDSNLPIWNPRQYFATVCQSWTGQGLRDFQNIAGLIGDSINQYVRRLIGLPFEHYRD